MQENKLYSHMICECVLIGRLVESFIPSKKPLLSDSILRAAAHCHRLGCLLVVPSRLKLDENLKKIIIIMSTFTHWYPIFQDTIIYYNIVS